MTSLYVLTPEPANASIVQLLEAALEQAREGELSSIGLAIVRRDGSADAQWSNVPSIPALLGATSRLAHRLNLEGDA